MPKTWLITGCSSGLGLEIATQALRRGDNVVLTARQPQSLDALAKSHPASSLVLPLDVTVAGRPADAVASAVGRFGRLDVLVNNAGYGLIGAVEEVSAAEYRPLFDTNVYGTIEMVRAALPVMRSQAAGTIVQISSNQGVAARAGYGLYSASKFALEGYSEALALEVAPMGIRVILVEPGAFRTAFQGRSMAVAQHAIAAYEASVGQVRALRAERSGRQPGDPVRGVAVILDAVDAPSPPLHLPLGRDAIDHIRSKLTRLASEIEDWEALTANTSFPS